MIKKSEWQRCHPLSRVRRATGLIFKRVAFADFDSDSDTSGCGGEDRFDMEQGEIDDSTDEVESIKEKEEDCTGYSYLMKERIQQLPLPHVLKLYLNYHRAL